MWQRVLRGFCSHSITEVCVADYVRPEFCQHSVCTTTALREVGCWFLYLQPYSPDLNPIEMAFSKLKAHLQRIGARTFDQMFDVLTEICDFFTPDECWNFFCTAGYASG